ncbi:MAG: TauD/TfdA family dioxygenase [Alphaproteobacteria bacterium]|nr:TauD/TfdA family dioxygenase [Alphaproteobacteria bacterium]
MASIRTLSSALGCAVSGIAVGEETSGADLQAVEAALDEHCVVVLPGQTLTPQGFVSFARRFGRPEPHVIDQYHHPAAADILILSNQQHAGRNIGLLDGGSYFHSDYAYLDVPSRCTMLYAIQITQEGVGTTFANLRAAYDDLPAATKARIDPLVCRHHYGNRDDLDETSRTVASVLSDDQKKKMSWVRHPLVRKHPRTGRKALYAVSGSSFGIEGMDDKEGVALLDDLKRHATQPQYLHRYDYQVGDVVIWDNCSLLHAAPLTDMTKPRTLWRITVKDKGPTL